MVEGLGGRYVLRNVEGRAAVVELLDLAARALVVVQQLGDGLGQRRRQQLQRREAGRRDAGRGLEDIQNTKSDVGGVRRNIEQHQDENDENSYTDGL